MKSSAGKNANIGNITAKFKFIYPLLSLTCEGADANRTKHIVKIAITASNGYLDI